MKANNGNGNSPLRDMWRTPDWLFQALNEQYEFDFDCCADEENKKCRYWHDDFLQVGTTEAGLEENECAWMNPPFSIAWKMFEHFFNVVPRGVAIYRCDNLETGLWQKIIIPNASWILIPDRRISYEGLDGEGARFPSTLIGYHVDSPKKIKGRLLRPEISVELSSGASTPTNDDNDKEDIRH